MRGNVLHKLYVTVYGKTDQLARNSSVTMQGINYAGVVDANRNGE